MKLQNTQIIINDQAIKIKQQINEGSYASIYQTEQQNWIIKAINLEFAKFTYENELNAYNLLQQKHNHIVQCKGFKQIQLTQQIGCLLLENCPHGTLIDILEARVNFPLQEDEILQIIYQICQGIQQIHQVGIVHRDIKLENIIIGTDGKAKICDFGSSIQNQNQQVTKLNRSSISEDIEKLTTPNYRSPEQCDIYQTNYLTQKVDMWALGCILFILCFQKPPFEGKLSVINCQYFIPENNQYSQIIFDLIDRLLKLNANERNSASQIIQYLEQCDINFKNNQNLIDIKNRKNERRIFDTIQEQQQYNAQSKLNLKPSIMDQLLKQFKQVTSKTEGWILSAIEQTEKAPLQKFLKLLIIKAWQKPFKITKFYTLLQKYSIKNLENSVIMLKTLIMLHNYFQKGPSEAMNAFLNAGKIPWAIDILSQIYQHWYSNVNNQIMNPNKDKLRTVHSSNLILSYCKFLTKKVEFNKKWKNFVEGNHINLFFNCFLNTFQYIEDKNILIIFLTIIIYDKGSILVLNYSYIIQQQIIILGSFSLIPFLLNPKGKYISIKFLNDILEYLSQILKLNDCFLKDTRMIFLQLSIILCVQDEIFQCLSLLVHLIVAFKKATNHVKQQINQLALRTEINIIDDKFQQNYNQCLEYFEFVCKIPDFYKIKHLMPQLDQKIPEMLSQIPIIQFCKNEEQFDLFKHFRQNKKIYNLRIPKSFGDSIDYYRFKQQYLQQTDESFFDFRDFYESEQFGQFQFNQQNSNKQNDQINNPFSKFDNFQMNEFEQWNDQKNNFGDEFFSEQTKHDQNKDLQQIFEQFNVNHEEDMQNQNTNNPLDFSEEINTINLPKPNIINNKIIISNADDFAVSEITVNDPINQSVLDSQNKTKQISRLIIEEISKHSAQIIINYELLEFKQLIGNGSSAEVFKGNLNGQDVAIKKLKMLEIQNTHIIEFQREIYAMSQFKPHQNLITFKGIAYRNNDLCIVTDFCQGGTLFNLLHKNKNVKISWKQSIKFAMDICQGMIVFHTNQPPLLHRDLKSLNLFLDQQFDENQLPVLKIGDFGLSRVQELDDEKLMTGMMGTFHWMAPEILKSEEYSIKADVYSFGIVLWEICCRQTPYKNLKNPHEIMRFVAIENGRPDIKQIPADCPKELINIFEQCCHKNQHQRPEFIHINKILQELFSQYETFNQDLI